ncbi:MAG: T9SS type A sorting domain-containing protein [Saprospiraceae bacterium]|nr:T9SS type A sorting domain-containing protein [Saprospiraceae bacterium]
MKKIFLLLGLCMVFYIPSLMAQQIAKEVEQAKRRNAKVELVSLLSIDKQYTHPGVAKEIEKETYFDYDKQEAGKLIQNYPHFLSLKIEANDGETYILDLVSSARSFEGMTVSTGSGRKFDMSTFKAAHYQGVVRGQEAQTLVGISLFENEMTGLIFHKNGNLVLGKIKGTSKHIFYRENLADKIMPVGCAMDHFNLDDFDRDLYMNARSTNNYTGLIQKCVEFYFETEYDIYTFEGETTEAVVSWVTGLYNNVSILYREEYIPTLVSHIKVWDILDPYEEITSGSLLDKFQDEMLEFNGHLGQLLTTRNVGGGLAAGTNGLCNQNEDKRLAISNALVSNIIAVPAYSFSVFEITHEFGHLMGSLHTHDCVWNGNDTAIDGCVTPDCGSTPLPVEGGTIMSYCHLNNDVGIDFNLGFGPQPGEIIRTNVIEAECLEPCCFPNQSPDFSISGQCNDGNWTITATPDDQSAPNHIWELFETTAPGATSGGTLIAYTESGSTITYQGLDISKFYFIRHTIWDYCYVDKVAVMPVPIFRADVRYTLEDENGIEKNQFCIGEDIFLDPTFSNNYDRFFMAVYRRPIGSPGNFSLFADYGWTFTDNIGILNLTQLFLTSGENPGEVFEPGFEYEIQFAIANPPGCIPWKELKKTFTVVCCDVDPAFDVETLCLNGSWLVAGTPINPATTIHSWQVYEVTTPGATTGGTSVGSPQTTSSVTYSGLDFSKYYYIKHSTGYPGCELMASVAVPNFTANLSYVFKDKNNTVKDNFCYGEDIYLDPTGTNNYDRFFMAVYRRPISGGNFSYYADYEWTFTNNIGLLNLSQLFFSSGQNPGEIFEPGYEYELQFAIANPPACIPWTELKKRFTVECCEDFFSAGFRYDLRDKPAGFEVMVYDFNPYSPYATHEWTVISSLNPNGGPYTLETQTTTTGAGPHILYNDGVSGLYYFVIHKVITLCGEYCFIDRKEAYSGGVPPDGPACEICGAGDCSILEDICFVPNDLKINCYPAGVTIDWDPVPGVVFYWVQITYNDPACCNNGRTPSTNTYYTTNTYHVLYGAEQSCFSWRVASICESGPVWTDYHCFNGCEANPGGGSGGNGLSTPETDQVAESGLEKVTLYPNPANEQLSVRLPKDKAAAAIRLLDLNGRVVLEQQQVAEQVNLDCKALPAGLYTVQVIFEDRSQSVHKVQISH